MVTSTPKYFACEIQLLIRNATDSKLIRKYLPTWLCVCVCVSPKIFCAFNRKFNTKAQQWHALLRCNRFLIERQTRNKFHLESNYFNNFLKNFSSALHISIGMLTVVQCFPNNFEIQIRLRLKKNTHNFYADTKAGDFNIHKWDERWF